MYFINNNVYIIKGYKRACIYDLNNNKLYHINSDTYDFINSCISSKKSIFTEYEANTISFLLDNGIISRGNNIPKNIPNINDLKEKLKISFAWIEVCTYCNLFCKHCYNESSSERHELMSIKSFKKTIDALIEYGDKKIQLIGGEPFCNKDICKMLEYSSGKFDFIEVFTNGTLLDEKLCSFLKEKSIKIALSVYSYIPEEHDKVTQISGSFVKTKRAIELLKNYEIPYRIATTHMKDINIGEKDTELFTINPNKDIIRMAGRGDVVHLSSELLRKKLITKSTFSKPIDINTVKKNISGHQCFANKIYISTDLEVYPCVMERRFSHGNISNTSLNEVLKENISLLTKDKINGCCDCEFRYACFDCRPDTLSDDVYSKPYYCTYDVKNGRWRDENDVIEEILESQSD